MTSRWMLRLLLEDGLRAGNPSKVRGGSGAATPRHPSVTSWAPRLTVPAVQSRRASDHHAVVLTDRSGRSGASDVSERIEEILRAQVTR
jgi:hypothetical protein